MRGWQKQVSIALLLSLLLLLLGAACALADNGQVSGTVWQEKTADGLMDGGENGVGGVQVILEKRGDNGKSQLVGSTATVKTGAFAFSSLGAGEYRLRFEAADAYHFTLHGKDSAALPAMGSMSYTPWFTLADGESAVKNAGLTKGSCTVSLIAFEDVNANGGRMQSEPLVRGVQAELFYEYGGEAYPVAYASTDKQGQAIIKGLSPATYRVRVALPEHYAVGPLGQKINSFYNCILPTEDGMGVSDPFTLDAKESVAMGVGLVRTGSLTGSVWYDANYNGRWDKDESGLEGTNVTLYSPSLNITRECLVEGKGAYAFSGLQPGDYKLTFTLPEGMIFTYPGVSLLSDTAGSASVTVNVQVDVTTELGPVGGMPAAGFVLTLYQDMNLNGVRDADEAPLDGAAVVAEQGGKKVETAQTDENGQAVFNALRGGDTVVRAVLPDGWLFSADQEGFFSVSGAQTNADTSVTLDGQEASAQYTAAAIPAASISGMLFEDADNSGLYKENSVPLPGYTVQAVDEKGAVAAEAVTDENGAYTLFPLLPGAYTVRFLLDEAYVASPYAADQAQQANHIASQTPQYGETGEMTLSPGQEIVSVDGGVFRAGVVEGYVLVDEAWADQDTGLAGVSAMLLDSEGNPVSDFAYGITDEKGYYYIKGVLPGAYSLLYSMPANGVFTSVANGERHWMSEKFTIESGSQIRMTELRGLFTSTLAGRIQNKGEDESAFSALVTLTGHTVSQVVEIHTLPDGSFSFSDLLPDTYTLTVTLPEGMIFGRLEGSLFPAAMTSTASAQVEIAMGESRRDVDAVATKPVSLFGVMYYDEDLSGVQDEEEYGAEGRALSLWADGEAVVSAETAESGSFFLGSVVPGDYQLHVSLDENEELLTFPGAVRQENDWVLNVALDEDVPLVLPVMRYASVSGQVWSLDGSMNGVGGVEVSLLSAQGETLYTVETDGEGAFTFGGLTPGSFMLSAVLPEGYLFARAQDTAERDSFVQSLPDGSLTAQPFDVPMGDDLSGMDIGIGTMGRIGDLAWLDENGNGMQDTDEPGMPGIVIELYQHGEKIASTETDVYGRYGLSDLYPGEYEMRVTMHKELKATLRQTDFPLVGSVLPQEDGLTVSASVTVPSGGANLHCDLGFQLRKKNVYPDAMNDIPAKDWRPYSQR